MTLASFIATTDLTDNAEIAAAYNALPTRYASSKLTSIGIADVLGAGLAGAIKFELRSTIATLLATPQDDESYVTNQSLAEALTDAASLFRGETLDSSGQTGLDFGNAEVRNVINTLADGNPTGAIATARTALLALATDTHGGTKTADDVAAAKAEVAANAAKVALRAEVQPLINAAEAKIDTGEITTLAQWRAEVGAWNGVGAVPGSGGGD